MLIQKSIRPDSIVAHFFSQAVPPRLLQQNRLEAAVPGDLAHVSSEGQSGLGLRFGARSAYDSHTTKTHNRHA
jgi:hypothetical protein